MTHGRYTKGKARDNRGECSQKLPSLYYDLRMVVFEFYNFSELLSAGLWDDQDRLPLFREFLYGSKIRKSLDLIGIYY